MAKTAVLLSSHQEVGRLSSDDLKHVYCMVGNTNAEDLLKVIDVKGEAYWCDEIEFED
jgi:hypothetical protein